MKTESKIQQPESVPFEWHILKVGRYQAVRQGIDAGEVEDCAMEFLIHMLEDNGRSLRYDGPGHISSPWLHQCAKNYARNFCREHRRRDRIHTPWPWIDDGGEDARETEMADPAPTPEVLVLRHELWAEMTAAIDQLPNPTRSLFVRHHLRGEAVHAVAADYGKTPHAVSQCLLRARRQLRSALASRGLTETVVRTYV